MLVCFVLLYSDSAVTAMNIEVLAMLSLGVSSITEYFTFSASLAS